MFVNAAYAVRAMSMFRSMLEPRVLLSFQKTPTFKCEACFMAIHPKVVWLRIGNCTRKQLVQLIANHAQDIQTFALAPFESLLVLS